MERLNYNHLYYFDIVATEGSISAAAKKLSLSPSTLSEQLKLFENSLETEFFDRQNNQLKLNDAGKILHKYSRQIFSVADRVMQTFSEQKNEEKLTLNIGIASGISKSFALDT